jgi:hypothetical protein
MTTHSVAWMDDPAFVEAYRRGMATGHRYGDDLHIEWRVFTACWAFAEYPNVVVIRGAVPGTLPLVPSERIAYLCIDMNAAAPERAALEYFWDKVVPGGVILLDDYGFIEHEAQRRSFDEFARARDVRILALPTGHGLLINPYRTK